MVRSCTAETGTVALTLGVVIAAAATFAWDVGLVVVRRADGASHVGVQAALSCWMGMVCCCHDMRVGCAPTDGRGVECAQEICQGLAAHHGSVAKVLSVFSLPGFVALCFWLSWDDVAERGVQRNVVAPEELGAMIGGEIVGLAFVSAPAGDVWEAGQVVSDFMAEDKDEAVTGHFGTAREATVHVDLPGSKELGRTGVNGAVIPVATDV